MPSRRTPMFPICDKVHPLRKLDESNRDYHSIGGIFAIFRISKRGWVAQNKNLQDNSQNYF